MGVDPKGFLKIRRKTSSYRNKHERIKDYREVFILRDEGESQEQGLRCMDCGTPFCHWGCPLGNYVPEWNQLMASGNWREAFNLLNATNNLPEVTGRVCPALCEYACVLGINDEPVTIRENELAIIEYAFKKGWIRPYRPLKVSKKRVAVVGSGPAGLAAADQLNKAGHTVVVFERDKKPGGIMRYGIPDFKLEKWVLDRRINILKKSGIEFVTGVNVGIDLNVTDLEREFDAIILSGGSRQPRDLNIEGRNLDGIHFAMEYLTCANRMVAGEKIPEGEYIDAKGKRVVVIGGGDTGADCMGVAHRQGAKSITQIELLPKPPKERTPDYPWPKYPLLLKTSSSHEEGGKRMWQVLTKKFIGKDGRVSKLKCVRVEFSKDKQTGRMVMNEVRGSEFEITADLVMIAVGFVHPEHSSLLKGLRIKFDERGNVKTDASYRTNRRKVFACGDMQRGQSLIVWAIAEGRSAAYYVDSYLIGASSQLPKF